MEENERKGKVELSQNSIKQVVAMDAMQVVAYRITGLVFFATAGIFWGAVSNFGVRHVPTFIMVIGFGMYCSILASELKDKIAKNLLKIN